MDAQQAWGVYNPSPTGEHVDWDKYDCHAVDMDDLTPDEDDVPVLSQGSSRSGKRRCEWDESDEEEGSGEENVFRLPEGFARQRTMAVPKGRKGRVEQGRVMRVDGDFEDAEFLDVNSLSGEVEMGGV